MSFSPLLLPRLIEAATDIIAQHAEEITELDQAIGDGDHVINLQRGLTALMAQREQLALMDWSQAWQKIGMTMMTSIGGASGSLFGTLFMSMGKAVVEQSLTPTSFAHIFEQAVTAVKHRGKSDVGEKTLLDVLGPVADCLRQTAVVNCTLPEVYKKIVSVAIAGMESTRDMLATKGRAAFLEERSLGHIDAGAKTTQLIICAIVELLLSEIDNKQD